jgi:ribosomal protein L29
MKKNDLANYRANTKVEIQAALDQLAIKLTSAYLTKSAGKLQNTAMIKNFRRDIAQLKTLLKEKQGEK